MTNTNKETEKERYTNFRAWTSKPNTKESDGEMFVMHTVKYDDYGRTKELELEAMEPMDAIASAHEYLENRS